jgi:hypothetical protein
MKKIFAGLIVASLFASPAFADSTIDALGAAAALAGTESVPIFQTANPAVRATAKAIANTADAAVTAARMPALTGNCTTVAGAVATTCDAPFPGYIASNWYSPAGPLVAASGQAVSQNIISCRYAFVPNKVTIGALAARIVTVGTTNFQLAIYTSSAGRPAALLSSTGNILNTSVAVVSGALAANKQVGPGGADGGRDLWWCFNNNDAAAVFMVEIALGLSQDIYAGSATLTDLLQTSSSAQTAIRCSGAGCTGGSSTFNTWPASLVGSTWTSSQGNNTGNQMPLVFFQATSVP